MTFPGVVQCTICITVHCPSVCRRHEKSLALSKHCCSNHSPILSQKEYHLYRLTLTAKT